MTTGEVGGGGLAGAPASLGDRVRLEGLRVFAHHGVLPHEAALGQVFVIDVDAGIDLAPAGRHDDLALTLDYGRLAREIAGLVSSTRRRLIEAVAEDVAAHVLTDERVGDVRVRVTKPHAPLPVDAVVSVEIARRRPPAGDQAAGGVTTHAVAQSPGPPAAGHEPNAGAARPARPDVPGHGSARGRAVPEATARRSGNGEGSGR
jgi:7,8-dihydroneopterin aldolase/epimerase/oxygenase